MELRHKTLDVVPPKRLYTNIYQAYLADRKKNLGKDYCPIEAKEKYVKISNSEKDRIQKLLDVDEQKFQEELFHYNNAVNHRGKQRYSAPAKLPPKPKKPLSSYFQFLEKNRDSYAAKHPKLAFSKVREILTEDYHKLSSKDLKVFEDAYHQDNERYIVELKKWNDKYGEDALKRKASKKRSQSKGRALSKRSKSSKSRTGSKNRNSSKKRSDSAGSKTRSGSKGKEQRSRSNSNSKSKGADSKGKESVGKKKVKEGKQQSGKKANGRRC